MNDAQSTIAGLKAQDCPGGGWTGQPAEIERATVADCLAHGVCGCIYGDAVQHIERLRDALGTARLFIEGEQISHALVAPEGVALTDYSACPTLLQVIDAALGNVEQEHTVGAFKADYSPLTEAELAAEDPEVTALMERSKPKPVEQTEDKNDNR